MHTDLSPHLHTEECNKFITALNECYNKFRFRTAFKCDSQYVAVLKCTKKERQARRDANHESAKERNAEIRKKVTADTTDYASLKEWYAKQNAQK